MIFETKNIKRSKADEKRNLCFPKYSSCQLAEFFGLLTGDGYIGKYRKYCSVLEIAGDSRLDKDYLTRYVSPMVTKLFNLKPKIIFRKKQNTMYLQLMSKGLNEYLQKIGFPLGRKKQMKIPTWIQEDDKFMLSFIQGIIDTDGSFVFLKTKKYPRIQIALSNPYLIRSMADYIKKQNISVCETIDKSKRTHNGETKTHIGYRITINGKKNVEKWMNKVGFRNKRHLDKYEKYKNGPAGI